ncbi:hypothetical protein DdX_22060 [Ditylenchus destructor]|uniref:Uncharacterized protein n=1 Tax=Ditylenchus destructor TaxID=166010 RepID=A0AAD4QR36_9BILA|nr:hypothetical protein DdX_22060 [Ditylenchus destructor]
MFARRAPRHTTSYTFSQVLFCGVYDWRRENIAEQIEKIEKFKSDHGFGFSGVDLLRATAVCYNPVIGNQNTARSMISTWKQSSSIFGMSRIRKKGKPWYKAHALAITPHYGRPPLPCYCKDCSKVVINIDPGLGWTGPRIPFVVHTRGHYKRVKPSSLICLGKMYIQIAATLFLLAFLYIAFQLKKRLFDLIPSASFVFSSISHNNQRGEYQETNRNRELIYNIELPPVPTLSSCLFLPNEGDRLNAAH